jgi:hypothetical protein
VKTASSGRRATSSALALLVACGGAGGAQHPAERPGVSAGEARAPVDFAFDSLDDRPVTSESTRGKPTVLAFVDTGSLPAQAQVDFLVAMAKRDADTVNYAAVALEPRENRELVELYRKALSISFPVALADPATISGGGPFGDVTAVPVTVILDRSGRVAWRVAGRVVKSDAIRDALRGL